ncbi:MAG: hypothetical protein PSV16_10345 [Flavobacterium sp.]|nr:hypothetical protein [Flavobacterium sp.]
MKEFFSLIWVKRTMLVIAILLMWQIGGYALRCQAKSDSLEILAPISRNAKIEIEGIKKLSLVSNSDKDRLISLFNTLENRKQQHKNAFLIFYPYHFTAASLLLILSSISVVLIFLIAQTGLNNVSGSMKTIFFTMAALTSFYAFSPSVFKLESNISVNLSEYILYDNLEQEIYNYAVTKTCSETPDDSLSFGKFHSKIVKDMAKINSIDVTFDYKIIPMPDYGLDKQH